MASKIRRVKEAARVTVAVYSVGGPKDCTAMLRSFVRHSTGAVLALALAADRRCLVEAVLSRQAKQSAENKKEKQAHERRTISSGAV